MPQDTFVSLKPPPGVWRNGTRYEAKGRWYDVNFVRWLNGRMRPVGGWQRFTTSSALGGPVRGAHAWRSNDFVRNLVVGTADSLFFHDGGSATEISPTDLVAGRVDSIYGLGWGIGPYGQQAYGTERTSVGQLIEANTWTIDNFGEVMLAVSAVDGRLLTWDPTVTPYVTATVVTNAPTDNTGTFVTDERHVVCFGADGNPRRVAWSSQEDMTVWAASATNTAGDLEVVSAGRLLRGLRAPGGSLLFTEADVHFMRYVGSPYVYGIERVGDSNGLVGPNAVVSIGDSVVWMGENAFWSFDGVIRQIPCDVSEYVFRDINVLQGVKIYAGHNSEFGEVWWFYPSASSVENNRYVIFNYRENWWSFGQLSRTFWLDKDVWPYAIAGDAAGTLYQHEQGWTNTGATRVGQVYAESGAIEIGRGERFMEVRQLYPDGCPNVPSCTQASFNLRETPMAEPYRIAGPYQFDSASGYADVRFTARQVEMRIEATQDSAFSFGDMRADVRPGSGR